MSFILNPYRFVSIVPPAPFPNTKSTDFDGTDDYVSMGNPTELQITGTLTLSAWIKTSYAGSTTQAIIYKDNGTTGNRDYKLQLTGSGQVLDFRIFNSNTAYSVTGSTNLDDGNWHHVMGVFTPSTSLTVYVDGSQDATNTTSIPATIDNDAVDFEIGRRNDSLFYFDGNIDEASVFNSAKAIGDLWDGTGAPTNLAAESGLVAWYRMGDSAVFNANSQWEFPEQTKIDNWSSHSFELDGVNDYIDLGVLSYLNGASTFTISTWINIGTHGANNIFFSVVTDSTHRMFIGTEAGGGMTVNISNGSDAYQSITPGLSTATWYHIVVVFDGGETGADRMNLYIDGVAETTTYASFPATTATFTTSSFIGSYGAAVAPFTGKIDGTAIYDTALTSGNVTSIYNSGEPTDLSTYSTKSLEFDGVDDVIVLDSTLATSGTDWSISFWFKTTHAAAGKTITYNASYYFMVNWTRLSFISSDNTFDITGADVVSDGNWHHGVFAYNYTSGNWSMYVDGSLDTNQTATTGVNIPPWQSFGAIITGAASFLGNLDEISYFSTELTSVQVASFYNSGKPTDLSAETGLQGYWRMGEDAIYNGATTEFSLPDNSTNSNSGTSANMDFVDLITDAPLSPVGYWRMGEGADWNGTEWQLPDYTKKALFSQQSFEFDGVNDYIDCGSITEFASTLTKFSMSFWYKTSVTGNMPISIYNGIYIIVESTRIQIWISGTATFFTISSTDDTWRSAILVYDGTESTSVDRVKLYAAGSVLSPTTISDPLPTTTTAIPTPTLRIGNYYSGSSYCWTGNLDAVSIFTGTALTSGNVTSIYNSGVPNDVTGLSISGLQGYWRMGEGADWNNTEWQVPDYSKNALFSQQSFEFDGVDDYIDCGDLNTLISAKSKLSISLWVNIADVSIVNRVCGKILQGGGAFTTAWISIVSSGTDLLYVIANGAVSYGQAAGVLTANVWHHIVCVFDGTQTLDADKMQIYLNGVSQSLTFTSPLPTTTFNFTPETEHSPFKNWHLGTDGYNITASEFGGSMDEYGLFSDIALTQADVTSIYNSGKPADISSFNPDVWYRMGEDATFSTNWTIPDASTNSNDGTSVNMNEVAKKYISPGNEARGESSGMDQVDRKLLSPGNAASGQGANTEVTDVVNNAPDNVNQGVSVGMDSTNIVEDVPT
tara:strand:- start:10057 stop:13566 length:3510 start_codon:yes stop_codon:yes gene_type:complete